MRSSSNRDARKGQGMQLGRLVPILVLCWASVTPGQGLSAASLPDDGADIERLIRLANVYQDQGRRGQALGLLREATQLAENTPRANETRLLLAQLYYQLGQYPLSLSLLRQVLDTAPPDSIRSSALNTLGTVQSTLNESGSASESFRLAAVAAEDPETRVAVITNHLRHELDHRNHAAAQQIAGKLIPLAESLESNRSGVALKISIADLMIRLAASGSDQSNYERQAIRLLNSAEQGAETLQLTTLQSYAVGHQGRLLVDQGQYQLARSKLDTATFLAHATGSFESAYLWEWQSARAHRLEGHTEAAIAGYQSAIQTLEHVRQELITGSPFTYPQKIQPLFAELSDLLLAEARSADDRQQQSYLQQVQFVLEQSKSAEMQDYFQNDCVIPEETLDLTSIEDATAVIYPVIFPDRLEVLVNIDSRVYQYLSEISSHELERLVNDFRYNIQRDQGNDEYKAIGKEVHEVIFSQVEPLLVENNIETLLVIPDGTLRTIPFAAIHDGSRFLVEKYSIATTPGISLTLPKTLDVEHANVLAGGISDAVQGFSGLPGVSVELARLESQYGAVVLQDESFNREAIRTELASDDYSIVHIATHGHFDGNPQESFLLTYDNRLTMDLLQQSIAGRRLAGNPLELLVLSACETAVGDDRAALGLAGVALKAGARSAIATLWQISDAATVQVIDEFYSRTSQDNLTKAQALRLAQTELINSEQFSHPTDWAPFLLIGNWL
jgi:CHAT domain-containing protein